jgi:hypothetical protein
MIHLHGEPVRNSTLAEIVIGLEHHYGPRFAEEHILAYNREKSPARTASLNVLDLPAQRGDALWQYLPSGLPRTVSKH